MITAQWILAFALRLFVLKLYVLFQETSVRPTGLYWHPYWAAQSGILYWLNLTLTNAGIIFEKSTFRRNPKAVLRHLARYSYTRAGIPGMITEHGLTTANWEAAQVFTKHFAQSMSHRLASALNCYFSEGSLTTTTISVEMVCAKLKWRKIFTSLGPDGIPARVLKHCAEVLATSLSMFFNRSLADSRVPAG